MVTTSEALSDSNTSVAIVIAENCCAFQNDLCKTAEWTTSQFNNM